MYILVVCRLPFNPSSTTFSGSLILRISSTHGRIFVFKWRIVLCRLVLYTVHNLVLVTKHTYLPWCMYEVPIYINLFRYEYESMLPLWCSFVRFEHSLHVEYKYIHMCADSKHWYLVPIPGSFLCNISIGTHNWLNNHTRTAFHHQKLTFSQLLLVNISRRMPWRADLESEEVSVDATTFGLTLRSAR